MANSPSTKTRGDAAEAAAARFLSAKDHEVIERQVRAGGVEIDLVARDLRASVPTVVFVEVRARSTGRSGHPLETIDRAKRRRLVRGAKAWLVERGMWERVAVRFDVVAVTAELGDVESGLELDASELMWVSDAFRTED